MESFNKKFPLWVILGCLWAFYYPEVFAGFLSRQVIYFFALTMFGIGVTLDFKQATHSVRKADKILLGCLAQFSIMPLAAFLLTTFIPVKPELALGLILTACVPGAMSSNVLAYLARADVAYSVALTTLSTLLSPLITPGLTWLLIGSRLPIPYFGMMLTILQAVLLPLAGGMLFRKIFRHKVQKYLSVFPAISIFAIVIICAVVVARNVDLINSMSFSIFALVLLLNGCGLAGGFFFGRLIRLDKPARRTLTIEIGMQNAGMGTVLALTHFSDQAGVALPSAVFTVWCIISASFFTMFSPGEKE